MPSVLSENDKEIVRRTVPKPANKIHAVAVARLYVAYPNRQRWTYTMLQGAVVLANDLVGNTFWLKLVDVSASNRGVLWDQEIYNNFEYNQDRTFFHSFELENCLAGLLFVDEKEAKTFKKKMDEREKNASKATRATPFHGSGAAPPASGHANGKSHSRFGGIGNFLHGGHRSSSAPSIPLPQAQPLPTPHELSTQVPTSSPDRSRGSSLDSVDPSWRGLLGELLAMGITEDQIEENADFIKSYIEEKKASEGEGVISSNGNDISNERRSSKPPPPPPAVSQGRLASISPQHTGSTVSSKRGPPPAVPPARRSRADVTSSSLQPSPPETPERTPSPPRPAYRFKAPPPIEGAGKLAHAEVPTSPARQRASSNIANPGPPPPPRPPKTPVEVDVDDQSSRTSVAPHFLGERKPVNVPPAPPASRGPIPPTPRSTRETEYAHAIPPSVIPPPLPPKTPNSASSSGPSLPSTTLAQAQRNASPAPLPPPLPQTARPVHPSGLSSIPPPPPLPSNARPASTMPLPKPAPGKDDLLASIRSSGGIGGGRLKRVSSQERRDRSAAMVPGAVPSAPSGSTSAQTPAAGGGLADALAAALSQRNKKVSASDDEEDDDDWDDPPRRK